MIVYVRCKARWEAPVPKSCKSVLLRQRQFSNKVNFLLRCLSEKCHFFVSECLEDMCLVKNGSNMYLGDVGAKELIIICDHVNFSVRMNGLKTVSSLLKGRGHGETHVTLIQEMNTQ